MAMITGTTLIMSTPLAATATATTSSGFLAFLCRSQHQKPVPTETISKKAKTEITAATVTVLLLDWFDS
jgi:hypothetical protein